MARGRFTVVSIRVEDELSQRFAAWCKARDLTVSQAVRRMMRVCVGAESGVEPIVDDAQLDLEAAIAEAKLVAGSIPSLPVPPPAAPVVAAPIATTSPAKPTRRKPAS